MDGDDALTALLEPELRRAVPPEVAQLAEMLAARADGHALAVLFYGSALRDTALDGVLDFYVVLDRVGAWRGSRLAALANRILPPNVGYFEGPVDGRMLRAKFAIMSLTQFFEATGRRTLDTTVWTRFSQPAVMPWARSEDDGASAMRAVRAAVVTAARWAAVLGPERGEAGDYWRALFTRTYRIELRVERASRSDDLVARDEERYARLLPEAWSAGRLAFDRTTDGTLIPALSPAERETGIREWALRERMGKPLNAMRLIKAAFTFEGAADYAAWKVERHSGVKLELADWQRRHPVLAAPGIWWTLRKKKVL